MDLLKNFDKVGELGFFAREKRLIRPSIQVKDASKVWKRGYLGFQQMA